MSYLPRASYLVKKPLFSAVTSHVAPLSIAARPAALQTLNSSKPFTKALSNSASALQPHLTSSFHQLQQDKASSSSLNPQMEAARPYSKIPRTKTFLGLNMEIMKDPVHIARYMQEQSSKLGSIYRIAGLPGLQEMVCLSDPKDVETAFRVGDVTHPRRFPIPEWVEARKELNMPIGLFLA